MHMHNLHEIDMVVFVIITSTRYIVQNNIIFVHMNFKFRIWYIWFVHSHICNRCMCAIFISTRYEVQKNMFVSIWILYFVSDTFVLCNNMHLGKYFCIKSIRIKLGFNFLQCISMLDLSILRKTTSRKMMDTWTMPSVLTATWHSGYHGLL